MFSSQKSVKSLFPTLPHVSETCFYNGSHLTSQCLVNLNFFFWSGASTAIANVRCLMSALFRSTARSACREGWHLGFGPQDSQYPGSPSWARMGKNRDARGRPGHRHSAKQYDSHCGEESWRVCLTDVCVSVCVYVGGDHVYITLCGPSVIKTCYFDIVETIYSGNWKQ